MTVTKTSLEPVCIRCKSVLHTSQDRCTVCGSLAYPQVSQLSPDHTFSQMPWEKASQIGILKAFWQTIRSSLFHPKTFFKHIRRSEDTTQALLFALMIGSLGILINTMWTSLAITSVSQSFGSILSPGDSAGISGLLYYPLFEICQLTLLTGYCHLMLRLTGSKDIKFSGSFRVVCYAQSAIVLSIIPLIGGYILSPILMVYLCAQGLHHAHGVSRTKALLIQIIPIIIIGILFLFLTALLMIGTIGADIFKALW